MKKDVQSEAEILRQKAEELLKNELLLAKEQVKIATEKYRNILENMLDVYYEASLDGVILEISPSIEIISKGQFTRDEMIGKSLLGLYVEPDARDNFFAVLAKDGKVIDYELALRNKDGSIVPCAISAGLKFDAHGNPAKITGILRDITERKQSEIRLKESEEKFRSITEQTTDLIAITDINGIITYASPASDSIFHILPEEMCGKHFTEFLDEPVASKAVTAFRLALARNETIKNLEMQMKRKDGSTFTGEINGSKFQTGIQTGTLVTIRDITRRKLEKDAIRESSQKWEAIIAASPDGIGMASFDGKLQFMSEKLAAMYGYTAEEKDEFLGKSIFDFIDSSYHKMLIDNIHKIISGDINHQITVYLAIKKDTSRFFSELNSTVLCDSTGNPVNILYVQRDITERIKAEQKISDLNENLEKKIIERTIQLAETNKNLENEIKHRKLVEAELEHEKQRLSDIIKGTNVGTWEWNIQTGVTTIDERWAEIIGYTLDELSPVNINTWIDFLPPDDLKKALELHEKHIKGELDYYSHEFRMKHKNGTWIWVLNRGKIHTWDDDGNPLLMSGTHQDITERKQTENEIRKARNEAEKANHAKSEFLSRMSHELRTPMNSILGFAQLLNMGELTPKQKKSVNYILSSGKHLLVLIDEVLDISRIESGRFLYLPEPILVNGIISEITDSVQPLADARELKIELVNSPANQLYVMSDKKLVKQVLINLLNNAVKYNRQGGSITIKTETRPPDDKGIVFIRFAVTDTGLGIPAESIPKLFVPFERIGAEKTQIEGTGLGLAVVKKIMDAMEGTVGVESIVGEGSTFWIELPMTEQQISWKNQREANLKLTAELIIANKELAFQNEEKEKRAAELTVANKELAFQHEEKANRAAELIMANKELVFQNEEKAKRAAELIVVNKELASQIDKTIKLTAELAMATKDPGSRNENELLPGNIDPGKTGIILYIEDNASNTELVEQILLDHRTSIQLVSSTNGAQAVPLAIEYTPDLILLDLDLPDIQGFEVIRLLQGEEKTMAIPVVVVSADAMPQQIEKLMKAGAMNYLTKPLDVVEFLRVIDKVTGINRPQG
ncbi:MAG: PAS domain S-box protein [Bacteroidota bacterium]